MPKKTTFCLILVFTLLFVSPSDIQAIANATSSGSAGLKLGQNREEFKQKIQAIKDEKKKALATKLEEQLNNLNDKATQVMASQLEKLGNFLTRIEEKAKTMESAGKPVAQVLTQIATLRSNITQLQTKLNDQKEKQYTPTVTAENTLRIQFSEVKTTLHKDIQVLRMELVKIRLDLIDIIKSLQTINGVSK